MDTTKLTKTQINAEDKLVVARRVKMKGSKGTNFSYRISKSRGCRHSMGNQ